MVDLSVSKSGNAALAFRIIKRLQASVPPTVNDSFEYGLFSKIHEETLRVTNGDFLRELLGLKPAQMPQSDDSAVANNHSSLMAELLHFIAMCITELYKTDDGQTCLPPLAPCVDLCILSDAVFSVQMESVSLQSASLSSSAKSPQATTTTSSTSKPLEQSSGRINEWNCLLDAFLSKLNHAMPYFNLLLQYSDNYVAFTSWISNSCLNSPPPKSSNINDEILKVDSLASHHLLTILDGVLFRVKHMVVIDGGFPSKWIRSTAMDLLLNAALSYSAALALACGDSTNDWRGVSDEEDDVVIEGVTGTENSEVLKDFRDFLASSGQT